MKEGKPRPQILIRRTTGFRQLFAQLAELVPEWLRNLLRGPVRKVGHGHENRRGLPWRPVELVLAPHQVLTTRLVLPATSTSDLRNAVRLHIREATPFAESEVLAIAEPAASSSGQGEPLSSRLTLVPLDELHHALEAARAHWRGLWRIRLADPMGGEARLLLERPSGLWSLVPVLIIAAAAGWSHRDHQGHLAMRLEAASVEANAARVAAEELSGEVERRRQALVDAERTQVARERGASLYRFLGFARSALPEGNAVVRLDYGAGTVTASIETTDEVALLAGIREAGFTVSLTMSQQSPGNPDGRLVVVRVEAAS